MDLTPSELNVISKLQASVAATRKSILDLLELAYGRQDNWVYVRSRLLRALGKGGLGGVIDDILRAGGMPDGAEARHE
jgi:hypothetical protein